MGERVSYELYMFVFLAGLVCLSGIYAFVRALKRALAEDQELEPNTEYEASNKKISEELSGHIEKLYATFEKYPLKEIFEFEPVDVLFDLEAQLHRRPLRQMGWLDFGAYPGRALTTFGDAEDFKHFLPRLFELYVKDYVGAEYDIFYIFYRFEHAAFDAWEDEEKKAVLQFLLCWLDELKKDETRLEDGSPSYGEILLAIDAFNIFDNNKQTQSVH